MDFLKGKLQDPPYFMVKTMVSCRFAHQSNAIWVTGGLGDFCHHGFLQEHAEAIDALLG